MEILTREDAIKQSLKYYFTGKQCPKGHLSKRSVHNCTCYDCKCESRSKSDVKNAKGVQLRGKKFYKNNKKLIKERTKLWQENNRQQYNYLLNNYRTKKLKATPIWANMEDIKMFYKNCPKGYHVDHIIPLQGKLVCGLHVANNLQYLTPSQNSIKSNKFQPEFSDFKF